MGGRGGVDASAGSKLNFAFRDDFGYLTASPSLTGTGLSAGVILHLPGLVLMKRLNRIVGGDYQTGIYHVRHVYGTE